MRIVRVLQWRIERTSLDARETHSSHFLGPICFLGLDFTQTETPPPPPFRSLFNVFARYIFRQSETKENLFMSNFVTTRTDGAVAICSGLPRDSLSSSGAAHYAGLLGGKFMTEAGGTDGAGEINK